MLKWAMPTLAQYKKNYPNLNASEIKLLHAARIAAQYGAWSLSHVRTIALAPLVYQVTPSQAQLDIANTLLDSPRTSEYGDDTLNYPRLTADQSLLTDTSQPVVPVTGIELGAFDWVVCKKVGYHMDDVDCDKYAYVFWCLHSTAPMTLMLGGNAYPMHDGQLVVFDARVPHAMLSADPNAAMVAMISTAKLTPELRERLGIAWRRSHAASLTSLSIMDKLDVDKDNGSFSSPCM